MLSPSDLVDAVIAAERLIAHGHARQLRLLAELGRPQRCGDITSLVDALIGKAGQGVDADGVVSAAAVQELTRHKAVGVAAAEVAAVLNCSPITAKIRIEQAQRLESALPATFAALTAGRIDVGRARMITDATRVLDEPQCRAVEARVLRLVKGRSLAQLQSILEREVILADPDAAEKRRLKATADREVTHRPGKDGVAIINAVMTAEGAVMVFTLVDLIAQANKGLDTRTMDQLRADALQDIADELLTIGYVDLEGLIARIPTPGATAGRDKTAATPTEAAPGMSRAPTIWGPTPAPAAADGVIASWIRQSPHRRPPGPTWVQPTRPRRTPHPQLASRPPRPRPVLPLPPSTSPRGWPGPCPATVAARTSTSPAPPPPCSAWTTCPDIWTATAPSPPHSCDPSPPPGAP